jgi:predicted dehydrogenase
MNRRRFLRSTAAASVAPGAVSAQNSATSVSANDKIGIGVIGCGGMGRMDLTDFQKQPEVEIRAVCDVFRPNAEQAQKISGGRAQICSDFRRVLERKDIDAIVVATPDH